MGSILERFGPKDKRMLKDHRKQQKETHEAIVRGYTIITEMRAKGEILMVASPENTESGHDGKG